MQTLDRCTQGIRADFIGNVNDHVLAGLGILLKPCNNNSRGAR